MVYDGLRWFTMVYDGLRWFTMVYGGLRWFTVDWQSMATLAGNGKAPPFAISDPDHSDFRFQVSGSVVCCLISLPTSLCGSSQISNVTSWLRSKSEI
jgi:hypothetical protein